MLAALLLLCAPVNAQALALDLGSSDAGVVRPSRKPCRMLRSPPFWRCLLSPPARPHARTQILAAQMQDAAEDAAQAASEAAGDALVSFGAAAGSAASSAALELGHAVADAGAVAAPVVLDGLRSAAPVVGEGIKVVGGLAWEGAKAAAPVVLQGAQFAGSAALEVGKATAPIVVDSAGKLVSAVGGVVVESVRGAWNSAVLQATAQQAGALVAGTAGEAWVPLCCQTNSCLQGPGACPAAR